MTTHVLGAADVLLVEDDPGDVLLTRDTAKFADAIKQIDDFFLILMRQPRYAPRLS